MADPYKELGLSRDASQDEIGKAYRRLAKQYHPDLHPGDTAAEKRFKELSAAYAIIGDKEKRDRFDKGEIDETGAERPSHQFYHQHAEAGPGAKYGGWQRFEDAEGLGDVFGEMFGGRYREMKAKGADTRYTLSIDFLEAVKGGGKRVDMPDGKTLDITIPPGIRDGQTLRLRGRGGPGVGGGPAGDALIEVLVRPHERFTRDGDTIRSDLAVTLAQALAGGKARVETVDGPVDLTIPKGSNTGDVLRLRGKGVPGRGGGARGDQLARLQVILPDKADDELANFVAEWEKRNPYTAAVRGRAS